MSVNLSDHVERLRTKLEDITLVYVERKSDEMTHVMVQIEGMKDEINALSEYIADEHDKHCEAVLHKKLTYYFSIDETKSLIYSMGISDFDGTYESKSTLHIELIGYCKRHSILPDFVASLRESRPRVKWPSC